MLHQQHRHDEEEVTDTAATTDFARFTFAVRYLTPRAKVGILYDMIHWRFDVQHAMEVCSEKVEPRLMRVEPVGVDDNGYVLHVCMFSGVELMRPAFGQIGADFRPVAHEGEPPLCPLDTWAMFDILVKLQIPQKGPSVGDPLADSDFFFALFWNQQISDFFHICRFWAHCELSMTSGGNKPIFLALQNFLRTKVMGQR